jgi:hypothetical protein
MTQQAAQQSVHRQSLSYQGVLTDASGLAVKDGDYDFVAKLYSDANGSAALWHDSYHTRVTKGVFNIAIGSGPAPLPSSQVLDKPLYLGITINGASEMRPLTQLSATAFALNVADSAITAQKMATDYVSSVQINGQQITSRGGAVNFMPGAGIEMRYDSGAQGIIVNTQVIHPSTHVGAADYWGELGNTATSPGTNFVGTTDTADLELHIDESATVLGTVTGGFGRVIKYWYSTNSPNLVGGYSGNWINGASGRTSDGSIVAGGGKSGDVNEVNGNYGFIGGGAGNIAGARYSVVTGGYQNNGGDWGFTGSGDLNTSGTYGVAVGGHFNFSGNHSAVVGGDFNWDYGTYNFIGGGLENLFQLSSGNYMIAYSAIAGGRHNLIRSNAAGVPLVYSNIGGGDSNTIYASYGNIGGGLHNVIDAPFSFIGGGDSNYTIASHSVVVGGKLNTIQQSLHLYPSDYSIIGGGLGNRILEYSSPRTQFSLICGGTMNTTQEEGAIVVGGDSNSAVEDYAIIVGGFHNYVNAEQSVIVGGTNNQIPDNNSTTSFIGGGDSNQIAVGAPNAVVCGGLANIGQSLYSSILGGSHNMVSAPGGSIGGGIENHTTADYATIAGGLHLLAPSFGQTVLGYYNFPVGTSSSAAG